MADVHIQEKKKRGGTEVTFKINITDTGHRESSDNDAVDIETTD